MSDATFKKSPGPGRCLITGASGYVGGRMKAALESAGWEVTELTRHAGGNPRAIPFQLGDAVAPEKLAGYSALVHCAYDFRLIAAREIQAVNVRGSELLLRAAHSAGVRQLVFISSLSAFDGCRSLYGRAKLEIETVTRSLGGWGLRPGLVYGDQPGGMFGRLVQQVQNSKFIPLPGGGYDKQYPVHDADLGAAVCRCVARTAAGGGEVVTVAHEQAWQFRDLLLEIAGVSGRKIVPVPVPWRLVWAGLRAGEMLRVPLGFRSDSLVGMVHQNPNPVFNSRAALDVQCRPFTFRPRAS